MRLQITLALFFLTVTFVFGFPGEVVKEFPAPQKRSTGLAWDGEHVWVADYKADKLFCLDAETGSIVKSIPSPGFWPMGLAWDGEALWNVDEKQKAIFKIDPETGVVLKQIMAPSSAPAGLAWDGETLWISDRKSGDIMKIDLSDGTAVKIFSSLAHSAQGLAWDGTYLWAANRDKDELHMIDPDNGEVILIANAPGPYADGMAWDGQYLWNVDYETNTVYRLVREDKDLYSLDDPRHARIILTHETFIEGQGNLRSLDVHFAIPEDRPYQKILDIKWYPQDYERVKDRWLQQFAHFHYEDVAAPASVKSVMTVDAEISAVHYYIFPDKVGSFKDIPADIKERYTVNGSKYFLNDPFIQKTVKKVVGDETRPYWVARRIFDYVRETLEYEMVGGWNTAPVVLQRGTGSCSEYTFSFIALCRAAGLPARYVGAVVVRGDDASIDRAFHRWPEVYLPNFGWIPMDPQGGDDPLSRDRAMNIGHLPNRFLITTQGGGDSEFLGWYYNSNEYFTTDPQVRVDIDNFGEWEPLE